MSDTQRDSKPTGDLSGQTGEAATASAAWPPAPTSREYPTIAGVDPRERFVPATVAAKWAIGGIVGSLGIQVIAAILAGVLFLAIEGKHITPAVVSLYRASWYVNSFSSLGYIIAGVLFLRWFYLAYRNLPSLGVSALYYRPIWAIVWFFVPILNLYKPYQMMSITWRASDPEPEYRGAAWRSATLTPLVGIWWVIWIFGEIVREITGIGVRDAKSWQDVAIIEALIVAFSSLLTTAGTVLIEIIRKIDRRQLQKSKTLGD